MEKSIEEIHKDLIEKKVTSQELVEESLKKSHEIQDKYNAFVTIIDEAKGVEVSDELLSGIPYGIKDNYSTKDILTTGSSNTLKNYVPFFTATSIKNLEAKGAVAVNKTVLDEFGMGGTGTLGILLECVRDQVLDLLVQLQVAFILMRQAPIQETLFVNPLPIVV